MQNAGPEDQLSGSQLLHPEQNFGYMNLPEGQLKTFTLFVTTSRTTTPFSAPTALTCLLDVLDQVQAYLAVVEDIGPLLRNRFQGFRQLWVLQGVPFSHNGFVVLAEQLAGKAHA